MKTKNGASTGARLRNMINSGENLVGSPADWVQTGSNRRGWGNKY
jgi:hypothetical protein